MLELISGPGAPIVSQARFKLWARVDDPADAGEAADQDAEIDELLLEVSGHIEDEIEEKLISQQWQWLFPCWPYADRYTPRRVDGIGGAVGLDVIELPLGPVISVDSIEYYAADADETDTVLASSKYVVTKGRRRSRIEPAKGECWPTVADREDAIRITLTVGYGATDADVPGQLKRAALMIAAHWWEHREAVMAGNYATIPQGAERILGNWHSGRY